eukprot:MONOS_15068.1-p1 / transcript=MONOS_15068.1 / gene=MONOS_15068 / organism=Monocercomonoides_exilis_PA203 / gene_product=unspecified product / transcript_product=unspecified product / location=Mono_scaffold01137:8714-9329(-) / protein_length=123 / sequence_SO=supercontig / SO=protein_coding / is_pseudo=false
MAVTELALQARLLCVSLSEMQREKERKQWALKLTNRSSFLLSTMQFGTVKQFGCGSCECGERARERETKRKSEKKEEREREREREERMWIVINQLRYPPPVAPPPQLREMEEEQVGKAKGGV